MHLVLNQLLSLQKLESIYAKKIFTFLPEIQLAENIVETL